MATERDRPRSQSPRVHQSSSAVDKRTVHRLGASIFADLLSKSVRDPAPVLSTSRLGSSVEDTEWSRSGGDTGPIDPAAAELQTPALPAGKETPTMRAYRTESRYYFSSRQLLPAGSLVFFSDKIQRYVHPTDGTLLDPHPRLQELSAGESQELEAHWQTALARY
jgi:hypothetical protein